MKATQEKINWALSEVKAFFLQRTLPEPAGRSRTVLSGGARVRKKDREEKKISGGHRVKAAAPSLFSTV